MAPRKKAAHPVVRETVSKRPTGTITSIFAAALTLATALGLPISPQVAAASVGLVGAIASWRNPRV